jgi:hypothetical protein
MLHPPPPPPSKKTREHVWPATHTHSNLGESMPNPTLMRGYTLDQFLKMRYNTGLTAAPASPLYGSPVCKRSSIQVLTGLNAA